MTQNSLQLAITALQKSDRLGPVPWCRLASALVHLLKLHSSGLSLPAAVAQLSTLSHTGRTATHVHAATLIATLNSPTVWLLALHGDRVHAHLPSAAFHALALPPGTRLAVHLHPHVFQNAPCQALAYNDTLAAVRYVVRATYNGDKSSGKMVVMTTLPSSLSFSTTPIWFYLESFPIKRLRLPSPIDSYTLQRVWAEGSLYPNAIFARVVDVEPQSGMARLRDIHCQDGQERVVQCFFSPNHTPLLKNLHPLQSILILTPAVHPTDESFTLSVSDDCVCIFSEHADLLPQSVHSSSKPGDTAVSRSAKRQRIDAEPAMVQLTHCTVPVDASSLASMTTSTRDDASRLTVHARLTDTPSFRTVLNLCSHAEFSSGATRIRVKRSKCHAEYRVGDELLFSGVQWADNGWAADEVNNLSTTAAILLAPFAIRLVNGREIRKRIALKTSTSTAHVCVDICSLRMMYEIQDIRLRVTDWAPNYQCSEGEWEISMSGRCFDVLFGVKDVDDVWDGDEKHVSDIMESKMNKLKLSRWKMTLTCDALNSPVPILCACVNIPVINYYGKI